MLCFSMRKGVTILGGNPGRQYITHIRQKFQEVCSVSYSEKVKIKEGIKNCSVLNGKSIYNFDRRNFRSQRTIGYRGDQGKTMNAYTFWALRERKRLRHFSKSEREVSSESKR